MKFYRLLEVFEHFIREGFVVVVPHERVRVPFMATEDAKGGPKNVSDEPSAIVLRRAALARRVRIVEELYSCPAGACPQLGRLALLDLAPLLSRALQGFALLGLCAVFAGELRRRWTRVRLPEAATRRQQS